MTIQVTHEMQDSFKRDLNEESGSSSRMTFAPLQLQNSRTTNDNGESNDDKACITEAITADESLHDDSSTFWCGRQWDTHSRRLKTQQLQILVLPVALDDNEEFEMDIFNKTLYKGSKLSVGGSCLLIAHTQI